LENLHLYEQGEQDFRNAMDELQPLLTTDEARGLLARTEEARANYVRRNDQVIARYRSGDTKGANVMFREPEGKVASDALAAAMNDMTAAFERQRQDALSREIASDSSSK